MNSTIGGVSKMGRRSNHATEVDDATYQFEIRVALPYPSEHDVLFCWLVAAHNFDEVKG
jgi:hypothetical protein